MKIRGLGKLLPSRGNALLALLAAVLLILAFPPFELWFVAWFALVPLLWAIERETERGHSFPHEPEGRTNHDGRSTVFQTLSRSFVLGWIFGNIFFFGTCWWLTFAPITYAAFPAPLAYLLLFCATSAAAIFPGIFAAITAFLLRRFGSTAYLAIPVVWVFSEFARYWITGNNWNAMAYSQAFANESWFGITALQSSFLGGVSLSSAYVVAVNGVLLGIVRRILVRLEFREQEAGDLGLRTVSAGLIFVVLVFPTIVGVWSLAQFGEPTSKSEPPKVASVVALQPNVPMSGLSLEKWRELRRRHVQLAESTFEKLESNLPTDHRLPNTVVLPESPMNFMYGDDPETQEFINGFARKNNVSVLFNSAEPNHADGKYFNSAVMVGPDGKKTAQYDKIYLLPFGEAVPFPFDFMVPAFVGSFSYGSEYDLLPLGEAKAGVMICFESHFGQLSREYVRNGADVIIEMTNDGYLGPTPVLRQHLANAVFRAVETNRPVLRVTNVGITAYINERGEVLDPAESYVEDTRIWTVAKSDGSQTFYVKYGDWFAWLCSIVTLGLLGYALLRRVPEGDRS